MVDRIAELLHLFNHEDDGEVIIAFMDKESRQAYDLTVKWDKGSAAEDQYSVDEIIEQLEQNIPIEKQKVAETTGPNLKKHRPHFGLRYPAHGKDEKDRRLVFGLPEAEKILTMLKAMKTKRATPTVTA